MRYVMVESSVEVHYCLLVAILVTNSERHGTSHAKGEVDARLQAIAESEIDFLNGIKRYL